MCAHVHMFCTPVNKLRWWSNSTRLTVIWYVEGCALIAPNSVIYLEIEQPYAAGIHLLSFFGHYIWHTCFCPKRYSVFSKQNSDFCITCNSRSCSQGGYEHCMVFFTCINMHWQCPATEFYPPTIHNRIAYQYFAVKSGNNPNL